MQQSTAASAPTAQGAPRPVVEVRDLSKCYGAENAKETKNFGRRGRAKASGASVTTALSHVSFDVRPGEFVGIMGPSGSGKSTLLNCLATIDAPTAGHVAVNGRDVGSLRGRELARFRREELGFVFQDANLLDTLTAYENIALALTIRRVGAREIDERVRQIAGILGIGGVLDKHPYQLSGGQRQRVAAARAVIGRPSLILADEPTGALDSASARQLLESLERLNGLGATILMVTHDAAAASFCSRILMIKDGALAREIVRGGDAREAFYERIVGEVAADCEVAFAADARSGKGSTVRSGEHVADMARPNPAERPSRAGAAAGSHAFSSVGGARHDA